MHDDRQSRGIRFTTAKGQHLRYNGGGHPQQCRDQPDMVRCTPTLLAPFTLTFPLFNYNSFTAPRCSPDECTQKLVLSQVSQASGAPPCKSESIASCTGNNLCTVSVSDERPLRCFLHLPVACDRPAFAASSAWAAAFGQSCSAGLGLLALGGVYDCRCNALRFE